MKPTDLQSWRITMELSRAQAAKALDIDPRTYTAMETGKRRIPRVVALACRALYHRLDFWE